MSANVLFVYGPSGAGKTRLLQMIEDLCSERSITRIGCKEFAEDLTFSYQEGNAEDYFDSYCRVKNLLLDNLWVLRRREVAAQQVRRLIRARVAQGNLTVLASDISYEDVTHSLPAIGECLKEHDVVHLRLGPGRAAPKPSLEELLRFCSEDDDERK